MNAVTSAKRPSRIVTRTRPGPTQKAEVPEPNRDRSHKSSSESSPPSSPEMSSGRSMYPPHQQQHHHHHQPGRRHHQARYRQEQPAISAQHLEAVRYLNYTWRRVQDDCENSRNAGVDISTLYYQEPARHPALQDFEPFDLESWWGRRLYQQLTGGTP